MAFANDVAKAIKATGLNNTAAAKKIGVTYPSLKGVLDGKSLPNRRSISKYAKFLGQNVATLTDKLEREKDRTGKRPGRPRKDGAKRKSASKKKTGAKRKPGRPKKKAGAKKKSAAKKKTGAKRGPGRPRKKTTATAKPKVDKRLVASIRASITKVDQLKAKLEAALDKLER